MADKDQKFFNLSGMSWVLYALLAVLLIAGMVYSRGQDAPRHMQCKESLFQQMFSDTCTPRRGVAVPDVAPATPKYNI